MRAQDNLVINTIINLIPLIRLVRLITQIRLTQHNNNQTKLS